MCIQEDVKRYVDMISSVFDLQVDCADIEKYRVAATGKYRGHVGKPLHTGRVFSKAMETKQQVIVKDPLQDEICKGCGNARFCKGQCEVCYPICMGEEVLGAITLASANEKEYQTIMENMDKLSLFMANITDLISLKAMDYKNQRINQYNLNLQEKLINLIKAGVIIIGNQDTILYMNKYSEDIIGCSAKRTQYLKKFTGSPFFRKENWD